MENNDSCQLCDICGDVGFAQVIATCSQCHKSREHIYCMHPNLSSIPESWCCEPCLYQSINCRDNCFLSSANHHEEEADDSSKRDKTWHIGSESFKEPVAVLNVCSTYLRSMKREHSNDFDALLGYSRPVELLGQHSSVDLKWKQHDVNFPLLNDNVDEDSATGFNKMDDQEVDKEIYMVGENKVETVDLCLKSTSETDKLAVDEINDHEVDMEIDMVGETEVGIVDVCLRRDSKAEYWNISDIPSHNVFIAVHSDQTAEESTVVMHLQQTIKQHSDVASVFSREVAGDVVDKGSIAVSSMKMEPDGNRLDASVLSKSDNLAFDDSSVKGLANGGACTNSPQPATEGFEEEEEGLACMVCRKGYFLKPNDILGIYCFSQRVNLCPTTSMDSRGDFAYTTTSQFNIIHFNCHRVAKRADAALENPRKEWKGAKFRNNGNLCNCIFPLKGPYVPMLQYVRGVSEYWGNLNMLGKADGSRLQLLIQDIVQMLVRFASGASFSINRNGGGRESNARFLPFMIQMAWYLIDQGNSTQRESLANSVSSYITASSTLPRSSISPMETIELVMVKSVLSESYETWLSHRYAFLQHGIYIAYMRHMHGRPIVSIFSTLTPAAKSEVMNNRETQGAQTDTKKLFSIIQPMLVFIGLIEQLQKFFKLSKSTEDWEVVMKEKLVNVKEMLGFSNKLLLWLDNMTAAVHIQEAFKAMGVISDVPPRFSSCDYFVEDAICAGKGKETGKREGNKKRKKLIL